MAPASAEAARAERAAGRSASPPAAPPSSWAEPPPAAPPPAAPQPAPAAYPAPEPVSRGTNGFSIASLVLGIVWIYWIGSILALVFGYIALSQIKRTGGTQGGRGMAIAGIVLGWIGIATLILVIILIATTDDSWYVDPS